MSKIKAPNQGKPRHLVVTLDQMKAELQDLVNTVKQRHKVEERNGNVRAIVEYDGLRIGFGLELSLPDYALKIAENQGHDISRGGIVFEVKGKDFAALLKNLEQRYNEWYNLVVLFRKEHNIR